MLSRSAEYALRIMAYFALHDPDSAVTAKHLAGEIDIALPYLSKILRKMVSAQLLSASKGHGGGFMIARPPHKIRFAQILHVIEGEELMAKCVFGWEVCSDRTPCVLHHRWREIKQDFHEWAHKTTLADVKDDYRNIPYFDGKLLSECMRRP